MMIRYPELEEFYSLKTNKEKIKFLLTFATLAPSTHNSQPWIFRVGENYCEILYDPKRKLPNTDKDNRGLYISLGACIENLMIISQYFNVYKQTEINIKKNSVGRIYFNLNNKNKSVNRIYKYLVSAITTRSNKRGNFNNQRISTSFQKQVVMISRLYPKVTLHVLTDKTKRLELANLSADGVAIASKDTQFRKEIASWITHNMSGRKDGMPGYAFNLPLFVSFIFPLLIRFFDLGRPSSLLTKNNLLTSSMICVITSKNNDKYSWLDVGQMMERIMLEAQNRGISTTISMGAIEIGNLYKKLMYLINSKERPQILFSLGFMDNISKYTPRYNIEDKIIS